MDQPFEILQLDPAITVLIEQSERLAGLEIGIPHLESQQDAPIVEGDGSILKPVSVNGALQVVHGHVRSASLQPVSHELRRQPAGGQIVEQPLKGDRCHCSHQESNPVT